MIIAEADRLKSVNEYYFSKKLREIESLKKEGKDIINLAIGSPDLPPAPDVIASLKHTADQPNTHGYQSYKGHPDLRKAIAKWSKEIYGVTIDGDKEILPLMGSKEGIMHISQTFVNKGDVVLVPNPGYPTYQSVSQLLDANIEHYNLTEETNWQVDLKDLKSKDLSKVKIMWLNTPNMPTGRVFNDQTITELIGLARQHQFLIVNDNPYSLILNDQPKSLLSYPGAREVLIELNSLSKSHNMAGWRVGWVAGNEDYIQSILKVKSNMDSGMFLGIQKAAVTALQKPIEWSYELNQQYAERKVLIENLFEYLQCSFSKDQKGMFLWAKLPAQITDAEKFVNDLMYNAGVFIAPGFIFGSNGKNYLRASLCSNVETIKKATERIKQTLVK